MSKSAPAACPYDSPQLDGRATVEDGVTPFPGSITSRYTDCATPGETATPLPTRRTRRESVENAALVADTGRTRRTSRGMRSGDIFWGVGSWDWGLELGNAPLGGGRG